MFVVLNQGYWEIECNLGCSGVDLMIRRAAINFSMYCTAQSGLQFMGYIRLKKSCYLNDGRVTISGIIQHSPFPNSYHSS